VKITKYWNPIIREINKPLNKTLLGIKKDINPDLNVYVTEKATTALFQEIEQQENAIRANPAERTTALLKKVFEYADAQKK
jgi:ABC-type transporter MlaC component